MRLSSITANRHIFDGRVNGTPLRLRLSFDGARALRLQVAGDGEQMIIDDGPLVDSVDMGEYGRIDIADVTQSLFPGLSGLEVTGMHALVWHGRRVGVKLSAAGGHAFHFWVDGDELYWGDEAALVSHDWLDGIIPQPSERLEI